MSHSLIIFTLMKVKLKIFVLIHLISAFSVFLSKAPLKHQHIDVNNSYIEYEIKHGDTLWSIADQFHVKNKEVFIYKIKNLNNLDNFYLIVDEILLIPSNI